MVYSLSFFSWLLSFDDLVKLAVPSFTTWCSDGSRAEPRELRLSMQC